MNMNDEEIVALFFEVGKLNRHFSEKRYGNMNPYKGQFRCLFALESAGTINQKELAGLLQIRPTSLSEILLKLEQKGLITRTPSDKDKRVTMVTLTADGYIKTKECRVSRARAHCEMLSNLSIDEKKHFHTILNKIKDYYINMGDEMNE